MKPNDLLRLLALLAALAAAMFPSPAPAQEDSGGEASSEPKPDEARPDGEESDEKTPGPILAIVGADIETVTQGTIRRGTILVRDGTILEVGQSIEVPEGAEVIDASGKVVTPGFVAVDMNGVGVGAAARSRGGGGSSNSVADALDPFDRNMKLCLGVGITSGAVRIGGASGARFLFQPGPGSEDEGPVSLTVDDLIGLLADGQLDDETFDHLLAHAEGREDDGHGPLGLFAGDGSGLVSPFDSRFFGEQDRQGTCAHCAATVMEILPEPLAPPSPTRPRPDDYCVIKLTWGDLDGMLAAEQPFYSLSSSSLTGPFNVFSWRENLKKARDYLEELEQYEADKEAGKKDIKEPRKPVDDGLIKLVKKEIPLRTQASSAEQIRSMIALARELDYRLVLDGAIEAWVVAEELGKAGVPVVITPRDRRRSDPGREDSTGSSIETPGILQQAAVPFAIAPLGSSVSLVGLAGRDLTSLPLEAAFAVRGGADEATALAALTIVPARILGLEDRIGSIEKGKDADLLILDGPPLDYRTYVETAIVNGKVRYRRAEDRVYPVFDRDAR
ncbi:amidohydrolase family protein [Tautonia sociabilis]|uniref:Amidohydrolase-related domain-containing protein n=1 Tax=Tautonia sociabilis TaxID=2080755 RepID=A0A432MHN1_9BACT|nr:amidohydrolase family protein [Tautonia sociabilis]RUL86451.1 hypothetical protein TsocGM_15885 [Tautonia sociabilis]